MNFLYAPQGPGKVYYLQLQKKFKACAAEGSSKDKKFDKLRQDLAEEFMYRSGLKPAVLIQASPFVATQIARVNGNLHISFGNFNGLKAKQTPVQIPAENVAVTFPGENPSRVKLLQFLGQKEEAPTELQEGRREFAISQIQKGAVIWTT